MAKSKWDRDRPYERVAHTKTSTAKEAEVFDTSAKPEKRKDWLDPIGMSQLQRAVQNRSKIAFIHGREYVLEYGHRHESKIAESYDLVKVKRKDGVMAPFGYVSLKKILEFDFENPS